MKRKPPVMRNIGLEQDARALEDFSCAYPKRYRYRYDYEQQDHVELIGILKSLPCAVMLSGYPSILIRGVIIRLAAFGVAGHESGRGDHRSGVV